MSFETTRTLVDTPQLRNIVENEKRGSCLAEESQNSQQQEQEGQNVPAVPIEDAAAWLRVLSGFLIVVMTWGPSSSIGAFEFFYQTTLLKGYSPSQIAWIGSMQTTLLLGAGVISGPLFDRGYLKAIMMFGCCLCVLAFMLLSLCTEYYQVFLTQGVMFGIGTGMAYVPVVAMISVRFGKNRPVAVGLAASGSSVGGVIFPIIIRRLVPSIGFPWTARTIGFIQLGISIVALSILVREPEAKKPPRKIFDVKAYQEMAFSLFSLGFLSQNLAYWIPFAFIPSYAINHLHTSEDLAFYLLAATNGASTFGRNLPSLIAQHVGAFNTLLVSTVACMIIIFSWIACSNVGGFAAFCVSWGFFSGVNPSISPVCAGLKPFSPSLEVTGTRIGMVLVCGGLGILIGNPIAGTLVDLEAGSFVKAQVFSGAVMAASAVSLIYSWVVHERIRKTTGQEDKEIDKNSEQSSTSGR